MTIDLNVKQLAQAIDTARNDDASTGLSVARTIEDGVANWSVAFEQNTQMTVWSSEDERNKPTADLVAELIAGWEAEWDD